MATQESINRLVISGGLTRDLQFNNDKQTIARSSLAVTFRERNAEGKWVNSTEYFEIKFFSKGLFPYLKKGTQIVVDGTIRQESWKAKDGSNVSRVMIYAEHVTLLPSAQKKESAPASSEDDEDVEPF